MNDWRSEIEPGVVRCKSGEKIEILMVMNPKKVKNQWDRDEWRFPVIGIVVDGIWRHCEKAFAVSSKQLIGELARIDPGIEIVAVKIAAYGKDKNTIYEILAVDGKAVSKDLSTAQTQIPLSTASGVCPPSK